MAIITAIGNIYQNNIVSICGKVSSEATFSHTMFEENFYRFFLDVPRLSNAIDRISVTVSDRLTSIMDLKLGDLLEIEGQFRSYNNNCSSHANKLILTVFAKRLSFVTDCIYSKNSNQIYLDGYICKPTMYRKTPFGREITDILLAVNRSYEKSDYIPCIAWGSNAKYCKDIITGTNIKLWGRIQSRDYQKKLDTGEIVTKTAYEVSISKIDLCSEKNAK